MCTQNVRFCSTPNTPAGHCIDFIVRFYGKYKVFNICIALVVGVFLAVHLVYSHLVYSHLVYSDLVYSHLVYSHLVYSHLVYSHLVYSHLVYSHWFYSRKMSVAFGLLYEFYIQKLHIKSNFTLLWEKFKRTFKSFNLKFL